MLRSRPPGPDLAVDAGSRHLRWIDLKGRLNEMPARAAMTPAGWVAGRDAIRLPDPPLSPYHQGRLARPDVLAALLHAASQGCQPPARHLLLAMPQAIPSAEVAALRAALRGHDLSIHGIVPTHLVAAIGAELPVLLAEGSLVVVAGASRVETAVLSLAGTAVYRSVAAGLDAIDQAIAAAMRREARVVLDRNQLRQLRRDVIDVSPHHISRAVVVTGRRMDDGAPVDLSVNGDALAPFVDPVVDRLISSLLDALRETPPELSADLVDRGIILLGGGALLRGLDVRLQSAIGLPVLVPDDPARVVVRGLHRLLGDPDLTSSLVLEPDPA